jgi:hypothetical protein
MILLDAHPIIGNGEDIFAAGVQGLVRLGDIVAQGDSQKDDPGLQLQAEPVQIIQGGGGLFGFGHQDLGLPQFAVNPLILEGRKGLVLVHPVPGGKGIAQRQDAQHPGGRHPAEIPVAPEAFGIVGPPDLAAQTVGHLNGEILLEESAPPQTLGPLGIDIVAAGFSGPILLHARQDFRQDDGDHQGAQDRQQDEPDLSQFKGHKVSMGAGARISGRAGSFTKIIMA